MIWSAGPSPVLDRAERISSLNFCRSHGRRLRVNITSETTFWGLEGQGGHTAFLDCVDLMRQHPDLEVHVNSNRPCDVLHSHSWGPAYYTRGLGYRRRRILTAHAIPESAEGSLPFMYAGTRAVIRRYLTGIYNYSSIVVAVSPRSAESILELGIRSPVEMIPNAVRTDRFFPSAEMGRKGRALLGLTGDRSVVLGVGQVQPRKGIKDFIAVARAFPSVDFVWVGGRPFGLVSAGLLELNHLMTEAPANLKFAGLHDLAQMPFIYNAADVLLFPSHQEICPYAPIEAAATGLPVVFRRLPGYAALYNADYCAADDTDGFIRAVGDLLSAPAQYRRAQEISRTLVATFGTESFVDTMVDLYDRVAMAA